MEAKIILADSGGFLGLMTGSELFRIQLVGTVMDKTFYMRAYEIESRSRFNNSDTYIVNCASNIFNTFSLLSEFLINNFIAT